MSHCFRIREDSGRREYETHCLVLVSDNQPSLPVDLFPSLAYSIRSRIIRKEMGQKSTISESFKKNWMKTLVLIVNAVFLYLLLFLLLLLLLFEKRPH